MKFAGARGAFALAALFLAAALPTIAQTAPVQERVAEAKALMAVNQQQLSRYTWQMQETVSLDGDVKLEDLFQVELGPDGKQVRALVAQPVAPSSGGRQHGIRHRMKDEDKQYVQQVGDLAKSYAGLNPARLQQLYAQGSVSVRSGGAPGYVSIVIANYLKQGDSVVLTMSQRPQALYSVDVSTYNSGPSDPVTMQTQFATLPDGTHYPATTTVNGESKNLKITQQSMNFALKH